MNTEDSNNTITYIALFVAIAIVVGGGLFYLVSVQNDDNDSTSEENADSGITTEANDSDESIDDSAEEVSDNSQEENAEATSSGETTPGEFSQYSADKVAEAEGDVVLFFAADWCPTCQALIRDIEANADDIPSNLTILEVDYDDERDLRREYGVVIQHTLVKVDNDGSELDSWVGGNRLETIVNRV